MAGSEPTVEGHYTRAGLGELILDALRHAGKEIDALTVDDLAPVDEFHIRGRDATRELAQLVSPTADLEVVDIGCGIGGPSRFLAATFGCRVTGIDLTEEYCQVAAMLAERTGLSDRVRYRCADATATELPDESVDLVWTQHASMNIRDKPRLYSEMFRILKPGGRLALHDIAAGSEGPVQFPVPWARTASMSFLITGDAMYNELERAGFRGVHWSDVTAAALEWVRRRMAQTESTGPPPLGTHLLMGPEWGRMVANVARNLEETRISVVKAVLERAEG